MSRLPLLAFILGASALPLSAQSLDDLNVQIHGYATQGFLYTTHNNIFYANSSDGSPAWTEAVVNVTLQPMPKLRIGVQARYQLLGDSGNAVTVDWAQGDYKVNDRFGVRFGKVKTPWGLYNETQDVDPSHMWALLPQSIYDITTRGSDLGHFGGVAYGTLNPGGRTGKLDYRIWGGEQVIPQGDGQFKDLNDSDNGPTSALTFVTFGGALHWRTPIPGLMIGASDGKANQATVPLADGSESFAPWNNLSYFATYDWRRATVVWEWNRQASPGTLNLAGLPISSVSTDARGWYGMASYHVTGKLSMGAYNSQFFDCDAPLGTDRFSKDWTISGRYDINEFIYIKADQHFIDGTALSLDGQRNPVQAPVYRLTAFKIGVSF
jgi:hypothetical protein